MQLSQHLLRIIISTFLLIATTSITNAIPTPPEESDKLDNEQPIPPYQQDPTFPLAQLPNSIFQSIDASLSIADRARFYASSRSLNNLDLDQDRHLGRLDLEREGSVGAGVSGSRGGSPPNSKPKSRSRSNSQTSTSSSDEMDVDKKRKKDYKRKRPLSPSPKPDGKAEEAANKRPTRLTSFFSTIHAKINRACGPYFPVQEWFTNEPLTANATDEYPELLTFPPRSRVFDVNIVSLRSFECSVLVLQNLNTVFAGKFGMLNIQSLWHLNDVVSEDEDIDEDEDGNEGDDDENSGLKRIPEGWNVDRVIDLIVDALTSQTSQISTFKIEITLDNNNPSSPLHFAQLMERLLSTNMPRVNQLVIMDDIAGDLETNVFAKLKRFFDLTGKLISSPRHASIKKLMWAPVLVVLDDGKEYDGMIQGLQQSTSLQTVQIMFDPYQNLFNTVAEKRSLLAPLSAKIVKALSTSKAPLESVRFGIQEWSSELRDVVAADQDIGNAFEPYWDILCLEKLKYFSIPDFGFISSLGVRRGETCIKSRQTPLKAFEIKESQIEWSDDTENHDPATRSQHYSRIAIALAEHTRNTGYKLETAAVKVYPNELTVIRPLAELLSRNKRLHHFELYFEENAMQTDYDSATVKTAYATMNILRAIRHLPKTEDVSVSIYGLPMSPATIPYLLDFLTSEAIKLTSLRFAGPHGVQMGNHVAVPDMYNPIGTVLHYLKRVEALDFSLIPTSFLKRMIQLNWWPETLKSLNGYSKQELTGSLQELEFLSEDQIGAMGFLVDEL